MEKIDEAYLEKHESSLVKCPKCENIDVVVKTKDGYFSIIKCNKCGYIKKENKPGS